MKHFLRLSMLMLAAMWLFQCNSPEKATPLYQNDSFTLYTDRVEQGNYTAKAISWEELSSDYQSPASSTYSSVLVFKFALNGKDNEMPVGVDHHLWVKPENGKFESPVITFGGHHNDQVSAEEAGFLPPNTQVTLRLDLSPVLNAFSEKGYFEDIQGNKLYKQDFKGVFVAGSNAPLSWDFENLPSRPQYQLLDQDADGIYTLELTFNPYNPNAVASNNWKLSKDISSFPVFHSDFPLVNALHSLSLEELLLDIRKDNAFMAGEKWEGVWTRDISYSILLSLALLEPETAKNSLLQKVRNDIIIQDTGTGGSWPVSTDRMTWALAALEVYLQTGDQEWLKKAYGIIKKSTIADFKTAFHPETGLALGESSFLDWRKQSYPRWMQPIDIYNSQCLGTNAVHFRTYQILAEMAKELGEDGSEYLKKAATIKKAINQYLWLSDKGYYAQFLYGKNHFIASPRSEALGEALCILFDIADTQKAVSISQNTPVLPFGIPSIYPQIPNVPPYHNNGIWPFVQAYWNWAMAKAGNEKALTHGIAALYRASALFLTNKENMVAENGDFNGTEINSDRQLWSVAGNLAMIYRIYFGIELETQGIRFNPTIPQAFAGKYELKGFNYRNAQIDLSVSGYGHKISSFLLDGKETSEPFFPATLKGIHSVEIILSNEALPERNFTLQANKFSLATPQTSLQNNTLNWEPITGATAYHIYTNGKKTATVTTNTFALPAITTATELSVMAVSDDNFSFGSEPIMLWNQAEILEAEKLDNFLFGKTLKDAPGFEGKGYIELSEKANRKIDFKVDAPTAGTYWVMVRYANGSGPINTDNKCALRSVFIKNQYAGTLVMPQRGYEEWSNWGYSNCLKVTLAEGKNEVSIRFEEYNHNMNRQENRAFLDQVFFIKAE